MRPQQPKRQRGEQREQDEGDLQVAAEDLAVACGWAIAWATANAASSVPATTGVCGAVVSRCCAPAHRTRQPLARSM